MTQEVVNALAMLLGGAFAVMLAVALLYARRIAQYLASLAKVQLSEQQLQQVDRAVEIGISYAEELARKKLLGLVEQGPTTSAQKLEVAKTASRSVAPAALADVADAQLEMSIEAHLSRVRPSLAMHSLAPPAQSVMSTEPYTPARTTPLPPIRRP